jgi:flagella basal body P-ring formation protein FlgA
MKRPTMRTLCGLILCLVATARVDAVEIVLRNQATSNSSIVRLGDIAEVRADRAGAERSPQDDALAAELSAVPLMPSPGVGSKKHLTAPQVRDLLAAGGVDLRTITFGGAARVMIATPAASSTVAAPGRLTPQPPSREAVAQQAAQAITDYLREQTGHDLWNVTVTPDDNLVDACWRVGADLPVSGGQAPWTGRQRFTLTLPGANEPALVFAAVERVEMVAFAVKPIARGSFVRASDVALRPYTRGLPTNATTSLDAILGKEAVQEIRENAMIMTSQVRTPLLVRRGDRVSVCAKAAGVKVSTYAIAQQDGSLGDLIAVQSLETKDRYSARVAGVRELEVLAIGAAADDVTAVGR